MKKGRLFLNLIGTVLILFASAAFAEDASIIGFSPQGEVKGVRQVTARFSEQMVSFGSPELDQPFSIECPVPGKGRWVDGRNWAYDFNKDLTAGNKCRFTLKSNVRTLKGKEIKGKKSFVFSTGGPGIVQSYPSDGGVADEDQVFALFLDGEATTDSVIRHTTCLLPKTRERVGVRIIEGKEREAMLLALRETGPPTREEKTRDIRLVQCKRVFPSETDIQLTWGKGIAGPGGVATTKDQVLSFTTRTPFTASMRCTRERAKADCAALLPISLTFSSPVPRKLAQGITLKAKSKTFAPTFDKEEREFIQAVSFTGPFPEKASLVLTIPPTVRDDAGRRLGNARSFPLTIKTDAYSPLAKFSSRFGILEKADPVLPVTVRSIGAILQGKVLDLTPGEGETPSAPTAARKATPGAGAEGQVTGRLQQVTGEKEMIEWLRKVGNQGRTESLFEGNGSGAQSFSLPKPAPNRATEVMGIPLDKPGLYVVELKSEALGIALLDAKKPFYVPTAALVTNLSAHFKWGRESSLVWVTTLDKAEPVAGAAVAIRDCSGKALWQGTTDGQGIVRVAKQLPTGDQLPRCQVKSGADAGYDSSQMRALSPMESGLFVFARTGDDMTFVHSGWEEGIEPYRFKLPGDYSVSAVVAHTVFDRTLLRAGETVHMKHIIRKQSMSGFRLLARDLPDVVTIRFSGKDEHYDFPLKWDTSKGTAETSWTIPKDAKLGRYSVTLVKKNKEGWDSSYMSGEFRVEEFRVPLMKATLKPVVSPLVRAQEMDMDVFVEYLSGGGATDLPVRLRSTVKPKFVTFEDYETFALANGEVKVGIERRARERYGDEGEEGEKPEPGSLPTLDLKLGKGGMIRTKIKDLPLSPSPQEVLTELEFKDPNGEIQTVSKYTPVYPSSVLAGVEAEAIGTERGIRINVAALGLTGTGLAGAKVRADLFQEINYSHRTRLVGGFYSYQNVREVKRIGPACEGVTDKDGVLRCEVTSPATGSIIVQAGAFDSAGNVSLTHETVWVPDKGDWWFEQGSSDRIDLIPEKKKYEPGETASFQVRMPMREATVLVTVEREGVLDGFVQKITGKNPYITVPVKASYSPNVFVSAFCLRGRVADPKPTAMIDLGRPSYKLGITGISVGWAAHELKVAVTPEKKVYRVRDKAAVKIKVTAVTGKPLPQGAEVALAAVDEGLLELMPNGSWDLLEKMMQKRGYGVRTATAQMQVIGKRHFGLKALPRGGGGGRQLTRELFDTLLLWKAAVPLDKNGEAEVTIPLNDSITGFIIAAVATAGPDLFGTGQGRIQTTQDLVLASGLLPMVRQGDRFSAGFLVRNTTQSRMTTEVTASFDSGKGKTVLPAAREEIEAGEAKEVAWEVIVPGEGETLTWEVSARVKGGDGADKLKVTQKVVPPAATQVVQATATQIKGTMNMEVAAPKGALPGKGGVAVTLTPKLSDNVGAVTEYMTRYPYTCMEQQVSKAVALDDKAMWAEVMSRAPSYMDDDGLLKYFPTQRLGSEVLTAYVLTIAGEAGLDIPTHVAGRLEEGLKNFLEGKILRTQAFPTADLTIRKLGALEALTRRGKGDAKYLQSFTVDPNLWPTSAVLDWVNIIIRLKTVPDRDKRLKAADQIVWSRYNFQGTVMGFSTEKTDNLWWLMAGPDVNGVRAVLTFLDSASWHDYLPQMMRGALTRQRNGRWSTTVANAWGKVALKKFSKRFEAEPVSGTTNGTLGQEKKALSWQDHPAGGTLSFSWPKDKGSLTLSHSGSGRPWATIKSMAAIPRKTPFSSGYAIKRSVTAVDRKVPGHWSVGDVVRVKIEADAQSDMTWVALTDPVPAGASILGSGLGRDSTILTTGEKQKGWVFPSFEERSFESYRVYYDYVPKGKWSLEYTMRLNNPGTFIVPSTRIEALYAPEMYGELPVGVFEIRK